MGAAFRLSLKKQPGEINCIKLTRFALQSVQEAAIQKIKELGSSGKV